MKEIKHPQATRELLAHFFYELILCQHSIKPQKFPPECTNNSPYHSINCSCC
uniref:Uncharacterized protein n=1 Tax=Arundo donax TaxID=35708 RepID=A0A0A9HN62_ARUDO